MVSGSFSANIIGTSKEAILRAMLYPIYIPLTIWFQCKLQTLNILAFCFLRFMQARVGVAKTQLYLRATLRNNFIKFSSPSCLSLRDLAVHTDRQTYIMMPPSPNTLVVLSAQYNLNNSPITQTRNPPREKHTIYSTISVGLAIVWRYYWFSDHSSARQSCAVLCCAVAPAGEIQSTWPICICTMSNRL